MQITRVLTIQLSKLTQDQQIIFGHLTYSASKLWNVANYAVENRQVKLNQLKQELKKDFWYRNLHSQSAQAVIEKLQIAWRNYFSKYAKKPGYQPKDGHFPVRWKKDGFRLIDNKLRLSLSKQTKQYLQEMYGVKFDYLWIELPKILSLNTIQEIEIVPHKIYGYTIYVLHIVYRKEIENNSQISSKIMGIDFGVRNLATVVTEKNNQPIIYDGRCLLSKLRWFAKEKARIQSAISKQGYKTSRRLYGLIVKERNFVRDYLHKVSKCIVELAKKENIGLIIIGAMSDGITSMDVGHKNNEKLHKIPFGKLFNLIKYKAEEYGIKVVKVNEAYTSQTCCVCGVVESSNRKYRGLYVCKNCDSVINADVNGAMNILRRVSPNPIWDRSRGFGCPRRIRVA